jgi:hypothetical protein
LPSLALQGFLQGYTLTGRTGLFPSYEAFLGIVTTMVQQYSKFNKIAVGVPWRSDIPSLNYIETSTLYVLKSISLFCISFGVARLTYDDILPSFFLYRWRQEQYVQPFRNPSMGMYI